MPPIRIAIVGAGKIARDQHMPALRASRDFALVAVVDPHPGDFGVPHFSNMAGLFAAMPDIDAVSICTPPPMRHALAHEAMANGCHVLLEKPPCASLGAAEDLIVQAKRNNVTLFVAWHSRAAGGVDPARTWLADRPPATRVQVRWLEDVRKWHPGQNWIWEAGGLGVLDPGINAFSILTHILPGPIVLESADLRFPLNRDTPIAARLSLRHGDTPIAVDLDWRTSEGETWDITVDSDAGDLHLSRGGATLRTGDKTIADGDNAEYAKLYSRFAALITSSRSDVDLAPLRIVADAFLLGRRMSVAAFLDDGV